MRFGGRPPERQARRSARRSARLPYAMPILLPEAAVEDIGVDVYQLTSSSLGGSLVVISRFLHRYANITAKADSRCFLWRPFTWSTTCQWQCNSPHPKVDLTPIEPDAYQTWYQTCLARAMSIVWSVPTAAAVFLSLLLMSLGRSPEPPRAAFFASVKRRFECRDRDCSASHPLLTQHKIPSTFNLTVIISFQQDLCLRLLQTLSVLQPPREGDTLRRVDHRRPPHHSLLVPAWWSIVTRRLTGLPCPIVLRLVYNVDDAMASQQVTIISCDLERPKRGSHQALIEICWMVSPWFFYCLEMWSSWSTAVPRTRQRSRNAGSCCSLGELSALWPRPRHRHRHRQAS